MKSHFLALTAITAFLLPASSSAAGFTEGARVPPTTLKLKPGEFVWEPERAPAGPVLLIVSKPEQLAYVYRNGIRIARTTVSTGMPGHETPVGVFNILEKQKQHTSTIYKGASMPYMERLTWTGIAMHAGQLPGRPASYGCVRLPLKFSELLYSVTATGMTVVIAEEVSAPRETVHPGLGLAQPAANAVPAPASAGGTSWNPQKAPTGPVTILISSASKGLYVYRNGVEIGRARFTVSLPGGHHIYSALDGADAQGRRKLLRLDGKSSWRDPSFTSIAQSLVIPETFIAGVRSVVTPDTTTVISDLPVDKSTQSDPDFKVMGLWETAQR